MTAAATREAYVRRHEKFVRRTEHLLSQLTRKPLVKERAAISPERRRDLYTTLAHIKREIRTAFRLRP